MACSPMVITSGEDAPSSLSGITKTPEILFNIKSEIIKQEYLALS